MNTRSKLIAAVVGLVVAAGAFGGASAMTIAKTAKTHAVAVRTTRIVAQAPRRLAATRVVKRVHVVHRAPTVLKKVVRVTKRPLLQRQALAHRIVVRKTVIR